MKKIISLFLRKIPRKYLQLFSHFALKLLIPFYSGDRVVCPVCDSKFRKFIPYGRVARSNALCPNCLALERHRLLWLYLKNETDFFTEPIKMLHVAPELCFIDRIKKLDNIDYLSADIESPLADIKMDIHDIPFEAGEFDVVFCNHVLEHVSDDKKALSEIHRVLKPGGWAILQIPLFHPLPENTYENAAITNPPEREKHFGQDDHVRKYGKDFTARLREQGFEVPEIDYIKDLGTEQVKKYALPSDDRIFKVIKPI